MKKINILLITLILLTACNSNKTYNITNIDWTRTYNDNTEIIYFGNNNHFAYYDTSGNPIDSYDLCESYTIKDDIITLKCLDKSIPNKITIVSSTDNELILNIDNKELTFKKDK